ncbi:MAG: 1-acyl-sn-glycerol-3-phosphate acyltransferase [Rhizobiales bacterium 65-9]|nr:1-acyl-sn-glycerol-3-phosphate acyltransferase [Hyphomicrobiales bacterium]OJY38948.1 MAG: 1-acyl-sn-glycerol-3-phosphate acyltransferase [Rhizobiales bacterium 65-9]
MAARLFAMGAVGLARFVTGVRPDWRGCQPQAKQRVYFANHASHGDFVLIWTVLPNALRAATRPVAAQDYWGGDGLRGFIGRAVFNAVLIERIPSQDKPHPLDVIKKALAEGCSLILFPEGTRNMGDAPLLPFKSGLYHLASARPEAEFVPVWIDNLSRVMPKGHFLPIPLLCSVTFGAPMTLRAGESKDVFLARARAALLALKPNGVCA